MAGAATPVPRPPRADLRLLAETGGALVRHHHPAGHPPQIILLGLAAAQADRRVRRQLQQELPPLRLTATADSILAKVERIGLFVSGLVPQIRRPVLCVTHDRERSFSETWQTPDAVQTHPAARKAIFRGHSHSGVQNFCPRPAQ